MYTVCIFMSTYNGEKYIKEQIDSIFSQKGISPIIYVRDDGSSDNTVNIIRGYINKGKNIYLQCGENIGFQKSFAKVSHTKVEADYYAFSDQDDIWMDNKLITSINKISNLQEPVLYGGNIIIVNNYMERIGTWCNEFDFETKKKSILKYYSLGNNMYGCTLVWNKELQEIYSAHMPEMFISHDVYLTMLAGAVGKIIVDNEPLILHRIHNENTAGIEQSLIKRIKKGYKNYFGKNHRELSKVAKDIITNYNIQKNPENELLIYISQYKSNRKLKGKIYKMLDKSILKKRYYIVLMLLAFNKY